MSDGHTKYNIEFWDFLTPLEASQVRGLNVDNSGNTRYDPIKVNAESIANSDLALMVYDVQKPSTLEWAKGHA